MCEMNSDNVFNNSALSKYIYTYIVVYAFEGAGSGPDAYVVVHTYYRSLEATDIVNISSIYPIDTTISIAYISDHVTNPS